jgi:hypothetical protein
MSRLPPSRMGLRTFASPRHIHFPELHMNPSAAFSPLPQPAIPTHATIGPNLKPHYPKDSASSGVKKIYGPIPNQVEPGRVTCSAVRNTSPNCTRIPLRQNLRLFSSRSLSARPTPAATELPNPNRLSQRLRVFASPRQETLLVPKKIRSKPVRLTRWSGRCPWANFSSRRWLSAWPAEPHPACPAFSWLRRSPPGLPA